MADISQEVRLNEIQTLSTKTRSLLADPSLIDRLKETISSSGYAGDPRPALIVYVAITSRLLDRPLNIVFVAQSGSGKNVSIEHVLPLFPQDAYFIIRASSPLALVYSEEDFSHRTVILWEADSLPEEGPAASAIRSLMSDQRIEYQVVERDESGHHKIRTVNKQGPSGIITTSIRPVKSQASTRMLTVTISDTPEQTKAVLHAIAKKESGILCLTDPDNWVSLQRWLALAGTKEVIVPFASALADSVSTATVRIRRDFSQVLTVIKTIALLHQVQREKDEKGRVIASLDDYEITRWLLEDIFSASTTEGITPAIQETVKAVNDLYSHQNPISFTQLADHLGLSKSTISYRINRAIEGGWIINRSKQRGAAAQLEPGIPMPENNQLPPVDALVRVLSPENHATTRTLEENIVNPSSNDGEEVFEPPFEQLFEYSGETESECENSHSSETVRAFESKTNNSIHTTNKNPTPDSGLAYELVQKARECEAIFLFENGKARIRAPEPLSSELLDNLRSHKADVLSELRYELSDKAKYWLEEWRKISLPKWRRILQESIEAKDKKREEYARWMLCEVLEDPEYRGES
ncbi:winged helix-turn-helix transcriptional regulator [Chloroflexota bacterium]